MLIVAWGKLLAAAPPGRLLRPAETDHEGEHSDGSPEHSGEHSDAFAQRLAHMVAEGRAGSPGAARICVRPAECTGGGSGGRAGGGRTDAAGGRASGAGAGGSSSAGGGGGGTASSSSSHRPASSP